MSIVLTDDQQCVGRCDQVECLSRTEWCNSGRDTLGLASVPASQLRVMTTEMLSVCTF